MLEGGLFVKIAFMRIDLLTLFPAMAEGFLSESILARAQEQGLVSLSVHDLRRWSNDPVHHKVDDRPFGGGPGMLLKPEPIFDSISDLKAQAVAADPSAKPHVVYLAPDGELLSAKIAQRLSRYSHLIFLSGHYEGIDERARQSCIDEEISIGEYILTNGTLPACVVIDCLCRFIPGVLGNEESLTNESFCHNMMSFPQYTRPTEYKGMKVPEVLLQGNHAEIASWRRAQAAERKRKQTPLF